MFRHMKVFHDVVRIALVCNKPRSFGVPHFYHRVGYAFPSTPAEGCQSISSFFLSLLTLLTPPQRHHNAAKVTSCQATAIRRCVHFRSSWHFPHPSRGFLTHACLRTDFTSTPGHRVQRDLRCLQLYFRFPRRLCPVSIIDRPHETAVCIFCVSQCLSDNFTIYRLYCRSFTVSGFQRTKPSRAGIHHNKPSVCSLRSPGK